jgi:hypothetical protein
MKSEQISSIPPPVLPQTKPDTLSTAEMLTSSELAQLRQFKRDAIAYGEKAFRKK